jgi:hypothetical protein
VHEYRSKTTAAGSWRFFLGILCIALVAVFGTIQAVHTHPQGDATDSGCALCVTSHMTIQVVTPVQAPVSTPVVTHVEPVVVAIHVVTLSPFALFTRPPPADAVSA